MATRIVWVIIAAFIPSELLLSQSDTLAIFIVDTSSIRPVSRNTRSTSESLRTKLSGQFLLGSGFSEDRGTGMGVRATYLLRSNTFIGATFVIHLGSGNNVFTSGYGPMYFFGGELGGRLLLRSLSVEPLISAGEAMIEIPNYERATAMEGRLYVAPGISIRTISDNGNVGIHARYLMIDQMAFFAVYLSYGV